MKKMINFGLATLATFSIIQTAHSSALIERDDVSKTIKVIGRIVYSGSALTDEIAVDSTREIQDMWSDTPTDVLINGVNYRVSFEIDHVIDGRQRIGNADSCAYNFVKVLPKTSPGDRSYYAGLGSRNAVFYTSDGLGTSTTTAHEFGHGLMLDHNDGDQREAEVPGIMFARGTLVRSEYQWNPNADFGAPGGTINPKYRKVRAEDIQAIPFGKVSVNSRSLGCLGSGKVLTIK
jgi:hypothetical protein